MAFDTNLGSFTDPRGSTHNVLREAGPYQDMLICQGCTMRGQHSSFGKPDDMIAHLREHQRRGHEVPDSIFNNLVN